MVAGIVERQCLVGGNSAKPAYASVSSWQPNFRGKNHETAAWEVSVSGPFDAGRRDRVSTSSTASWAARRTSVAASL